jgi:hypothetical protein
VWGQPPSSRRSRLPVAALPRGPWRAFAALGQHGHSVADACALGACAFDELAKSMSLVNALRVCGQHSGSTLLPVAPALRQPRASTSTRAWHRLKPGSKKLGRPRSSCWAAVAQLVARANARQACTRGDWSTCTPRGPDKGVAPRQVHARRRLRCGGLHCRHPAARSRRGTTLPRPAARCMHRNPHARAPVKPRSPRTHARVAAPTFGGPSRGRKPRGKTCSLDASPDASRLVHCTIHVHHTLLHKARLAVETRRHHETYCSCVDQRGP